MIIVDQNVGLIDFYTSGRIQAHTVIGIAPHPEFYVESIYIILKQLLRVKNGRYDRFLRVTIGVTSSRECRFQH